MSSRYKLDPNAKKYVNWNEFDKLVSYQCTQAEIASFFDMTIKTLKKRCLEDLGVPLSSIWDKRQLAGKMRLRKLQFSLIEKGGSGSAAMAIWLDKKMFPNENPDKPAPPENQPDPLLELKREDFREFCDTAQYPRPFDVQLEMREFCLDGVEPRMLLGSRGYGKSDYATVLGSAYKIYTDPLTTIVIVSKSRTRNAAMIEEIATALKANGVELDKQNSTCIRVKGHVGKDHSVEVITIGSSFRGRHPDLVIMDDPVTEDDVSPAMRARVKRKYDEAFKLCTNICIIGQPVHADDLYEELRPKLLKREYPHGMIPELDEDLEAMRLAGVDPNTISMSYHLKVPKDGAMIFSNLRELEAWPENSTAVAWMDPSDGGDFTAITIVTAFGQGIAAEGRCFKKAWFHCIDTELIDWLKSRNVKKLAFETNATGDHAIIQLRQAFKKGGVDIGIVKRYTTTNKHSDIVAAGSVSHMIHLSKDSDSNYTKQVEKYELKAKNDDAPDSLARCLKWIGYIKGKK